MRGFDDRKKSLTANEKEDPKLRVDPLADSAADPLLPEVNDPQVRTSEASAGDLDSDLSPNSQQDAFVDRPVRGRLRDDDIESKSGNYLVTFGYPGAGKTTFQSFLAYYVNHSSEFRSRLVVSPEDSVQGWEPQAIYNEWLKLWRQGIFPRRNEIQDHDIRELSFEVNPKKGVRTPLKFSFLEVSGELMRTVIADEREDPNLTETIRRYFENSSIRMTLVLMIDPDHDQAGENDLLFQNLFTFLEVNYPGFADRSSLALLISKPERALSMLKNARPGLKHHASLHGELCEDYIEAFLPATYNIFDAWPSTERTSIMTLHLGEMEGSEGDPRLVSPDYKDISSIFEWFYYDFTRERLGPKWWQRVFEWIKQ